MEAQQQQKRPIEEVDAPLIQDVKAVIIDIEGTACPVSFVKDRLFPYVTQNLEDYLNRRFDEDELKEDIKALRELTTQDKADNVEGVVEIPSDCGKEDTIKAVVGNVKWQMEQDRKTTALKQLQGHIWKEGYKTGKIKAELYEDVGPALQHLVESDIDVYVYSSGSKESQELLFGNTEEGDLVELFSGFFDTTIGPKREKESYKKIAEQIDVAPENILFLTDTPAEAEAANNANLRTALVARDGNESITEEHFQNYLVIETFSELLGEDDDDFKRIETEDNGEFNEDDEDDVDDDVVDDDDPDDDDEDDDDEDDA